MSARYLQLSEGETTASSDATVVFNCGTADYRAKFVDWTRCNGGGFGQTCISTT